MAPGLRTEKTKRERSRVSTAIVWFRRDLRLDDNPAWAAATSDHDRVLPLFVLDGRLLDRAGRFRRDAMLGAIGGLDQELRDLGTRLHVVAGEPSEVVPAVVGASAAVAVYLNRDVTPYATRRDREVESALDVPVHESWGNGIHAPGSILTADGSVPRVFSAFYRRWQQLEFFPEPVPGAAEIITLDGGVEVPPTDDLPTDDPIAGRPASAADVDDRLHTFIDDRLAEYPTDRDLPAILGTSRLSIDLKTGTLSAAVARRAAIAAGPVGAPFVRQLAWRDWFAHLLYETPGLVDNPQRPEYAAIEWRNDPDEIAAWKAGCTGFPIVDAGMRELAATGYMHNRVRMITASFFVKDLLSDWRIGERYFRHLLGDGDVPQNVGNWQWVAGTGPDAAPYFRVFNPTLQSAKFDPKAAYLRRWVPELAVLDDRAIHEPSKLGPLELAAAGITLGADYPSPIVDHAAARVRAIDAYKRARTP